MPHKPAGPCSFQGCANRATSHGRCALHPRFDQRSLLPKGSSAARGYGYAWQKIRAKHLVQYPLCARCGALATDVDHIRPLNAGGTNDDDNLQSLCHSCHAHKTATLDGGFGKRP